MAFSATVENTRQNPVAALSRTYLPPRFNNLLRITVIFAMQPYLKTADRDASFSSTLFVFALTLSWLSAVDAAWLRGWGFRELKQIEPQRQNSSSLNLSCTWSNVDGCYLDYFDHLPSSEIRDYYGIDEKCRLITNVTLCDEDVECTWTSLVGSSVSGCYANIDKAAVKKCQDTKRRNVAEGTLCLLWKYMDACNKTDPLALDPCKTVSGNITCVLEDNGCFLDQSELVRMEFPDRQADVEHILDMQRTCEAATTLEDCEAYRNQN